MILLLKEKNDKLMENLVFKEAREEELSLILEIYNYYIINSTTNYYINPISIQQLKNHVFINHGTYKTFLIYNNDNMIGFCFVTQFRKKDAYARTGEIGIYLKPDFTGKKFGEQIISHLEEVAKKSNIKVLVASISSENIPSMKLVEKMGYDKCAHYKEVAEKFGRLLGVIDYQKIL
jgi:phosphinothricin acetyltransferase